MGRITFAILTGILVVSFAAAGDKTAPLRLVTKIAAPGMTGTWDHLTGDAAGKRMFVSAQEDQVVWVFDLNKNEPEAKITADFNRPQGLFYVPSGYLYVSNGRNGTLKVVDGRTRKLVKTIPLTLGADMMDYDPKTKYLYVDHGGKDSNRGPGALAVIDTSKQEKIADVVTDWRPGAVELDKSGAHLFVTLPGANQIGIVDTKAQKIATTYPIEAPAKPVALALDNNHRRVFVGTRTPDKFIVLDMDSGKTLATLPSVGGISGMFFDAAHQRVYVSGLDGIVEVYQQSDPQHYSSCGRMNIVPKAGTSLFMPTLSRYYVAAPPQNGEPGEIWVFEPVS